MKIDGTGIPPVSGARKPAPPPDDNKPGRPPSSAAAQSTDGVEISIISQALARLADVNDIREDLVAGILQQLEAGEYLDQEKLRSAVERLYSSQQ